MTSERLPLANRMVLDLFGPLKSVRGKFQPQQLWALESMMQTLWRFDRNEKREWLRTVRAALNLLENGCNLFPREIAHLVYDNFDQLEPSQMEVFGLVKEVWGNDESTEPDKRFRPVCELYVSLYEKFYPLLIAPLIAADTLLRLKVPIANLIQPNGRARHAAIEELEIGRNYPKGLLTDGLNRNLRNSISHRRYEVISAEIIRMEDRDPRTDKLTWGSVDYLYYDLRNFVLKFLHTCDALLATLIMFDVNNHEVLSERGFIKLESRKMRFDIAEIHFRTFAETMGFNLESFREADFTSLEVTLKVLGWTQEGPSEIYVGGSGWARKYIEEVRTEQIEVRAQVYGLLQSTLDIHDRYEWVVVSVVRSDGTNVGIVKTNRAARQVIFDGKAPIDQVRAQLTEDTLADESMPVVIRSLPYEV